MRSILLLPLLVMAFAATTAYAQTTQLKQQGAGGTKSFLAPGPVEKSGSESVSTGSLGKAHTSGVIQLAPWDGVSFCDDLLTVRVLYVSGSFIDTTASGDQLHRVLAESPASTLCFNLIDQTSTFEIHTVIVGGTGRFEGAAGHTLATGSAQMVDEGHAAFSFELEGSIERGD